MRSPGRFPRERVEQLAGGNPRQQVDAGDAQTVEVAGRVGLSPANLLQRRVADGSRHRPGFGVEQVDFMFGDTEIDEHQMAVLAAADDIFGFDIPVDDLVMVDELQDGQQVPEQFPHGFFAERFPEIQLLQEIFSLDIFLHQVQSPLGFQTGVQVRDLGMIAQLLQPHRLLVKQVCGFLDGGEILLLGGELFEDAGGSRSLFIDAQKSPAHAPAPEILYGPILAIEQQR